MREDVRKAIMCAFTHFQYIEKYNDFIEEEKDKTCIYFIGLDSPIIVTETTTNQYKCFSQTNGKTKWLRFKEEDLSRFDHVTVTIFDVIACEDEIQREINLKIYKRINASASMAIIEGKASDNFYFSRDLTIFKRSGDNWFFLHAPDYLDDLDDFDFQWFKRTRMQKNLIAREINRQDFLNFIEEHGGILPCSN